MSNVVVVDASLAIKWVLLEHDSNTAITLLDTWISEGKGIIAPALFTYEVTNILHRQVVTSKLSYDEAKRGLKKLFSIGVSLKFLPYEDLSTHAIELAHHFNLPAAYDAHYLALAHRESCEYWTADTRLWNVAKREINWIHWLGDYHPVP